MRAGAPGQVLPAVVAAGLDAKSPVGETSLVLALAITHHTGLRLAEFGFLLAAIAGALMLLGAIVPFGQRVGTALAGIALGAGGVLLIVAAHWGHFS